MTAYARRQWSRALAAKLGITRLEDRVTPDATYFNLAGGSLTQDWTNTGLITANDDWSGVPSIVGYRGDDITGGTGVDPQTLLGEGTVTVDVNANQTNPNTFTTGGVSEFEIANPTVALAGSGTADAPSLLFFLNTTGRENIRVQYNVRDLESSADDAIQQVALQYRLGDTGNFTNVPAGYVADATEANKDTKVSAIDVTLPAETKNLAKLQVRIITSNAVGSDEWVGIDDIVISSTAIPPNMAPVITSNGGGASATVSLAENTVDVTTVTATDGDMNPITFSLTGGADQALFAIDAMNGKLSFKAAPNFEMPTDAGANNVYDVTVRAFDGIDFDEQAIAVTVTDAAEAPRITSNGGGATAMVSIAENSKDVTTVMAVDEDGTTPTYKLAGGADELRFSIDSVSGKLAFKAAPDVETPTDAGMNNTYVVIVAATDGVLSGTQTITVTVTDVNEFPPDITSNGGGATATVNILENTTGVTTVVATDKDPDGAITYKITGGKDSAKFTINATTGVLEFKAAPNFEVKADSDADNKYEVSVTASDGTNSDAQAITVVVDDVDEPPVFTSDGGTPTTIFRFEGVAAVTTAVAKDPENKTPITYVLAGGADAALFLIDAGTGALSFLIAPDFENPADANADNFYELMLSATEGTTTGFQMMTVRIDNVNEAPTFTAGADPTVNEDAGLQTVPGFLTKITTGPSGVFVDLGTAVTFNVTNDNAALFLTAPSIDGSGTLTFAALPNASGTAKVTVIAMDDGGTDNGGVDTSAPQFVTITVNPVNDAPDFSIGGNQTVNEDAGAQSKSSYLTSVSPGPADEMGQTLTLTVTNDNAALFLVAPAIDGGGLLTYTPAANANGFAMVTVKLQDNGGTLFGGVDTKTMTFRITVNAVNDAPTFALGGNQTADEDAGAQSVPGFASAISAGPLNESGQTVSFLVSNDNAALFATAPAIDASGNLTYALAPDAFGTATVTVQAKDDGGTMNGGVDSSPAQTFTIAANAVNDAPTVSLPASTTVLEDAGAVATPAFATGLSAGPANESTQTLTITLTNDNTGLFAVQPALDLAGQLTFTPAANANGLATVTVKVQDNGGTSFGGMDTTTKTFTIQVDAVNDAPSFVVPAEAATTDNTGLNTVAPFATMIVAGPADESAQSVTFSLSNDNMALFDVQPAIDASGTLTFTVAANVIGLATVTVTARDDGGTLLGGDDTSDPQTFLIRILGKNVEPSFLVGADQTVDEDSGSAAVPGFLTMISPGPVLEVLQKVSFLVSNDNAALFASAPAIDAMGNLTYTPAANAFGTATVTVVAMDDGGTANGGDDTSDPQTFTLTVNAVNDVPSFAVGGKQTVLEDAGAQVVAGFAATISTGPANESTQAPTFLISTDNPSLFASGPAIDANGQLTYTTAPDANGTAIVTVRIMDDGGTANGGVDTSAPQTFAVVVNPVNDAPTFLLGTAKAVDEDAGTQLVAGFLTNESVGPANEAGQTMARAVVSTNAPLFAIPPAIDAAGNLTYTPASNANGTATVTVTATDSGGTANGGSDTTVLSFTITVNAVNDAPDFGLTSKAIVDEDAGPQSFDGFAFGATAGPPDEAGQPLAFTAKTTVLTGDLAFSQAPAIDANGRLTFAALPDSFGTATVVVTLDDGNGATATQSFSLVVNPVNDPPTSTVLQPTPPRSGVGPQTVPGVLALGTGAANEADTLAVTVGIASTEGNIGFTTPPAIDANGTLTYEARRNSIGSAKLAITVSDGTNATTVQFVTISVDTTGPVETVGYPEFAVGSDLGLTYVSFHNPDRSERFFSPAFPGTEFGARVAAADFTGDGIADLVLGSGVGRSSLVQVIDAVSQQALFAIQPFETAFTGGVYVAAGDLDGDGVADLVITPDEGGGPRVRVFDGATFKLRADFFGIDDANFRGGARAALGDLNGDAKADLVVAAGFGGGPRVAGFDGAAIADGKPVKLFNDFFAFEQTLRNGAFIAVGDIDGDGRAEIIGGGGPGGGPRVLAFDGATLLQSGGATLKTVANFFAGDTDDRGGIRIAVKDLDGDKRADLVVGSGTDNGSTVTAYLAPNLGFAFPPKAFTFEAFDGFAGGVFVG